MTKIVHFFFVTKSMSVQTQSSRSLIGSFQMRIELDSAF